VSATVNQPSNLNFLSPVGFNFSLKKLPNTVYFIQSVNLPSVTLGEYSFPTPFSRIPVPGDHLEFGELTVAFRIDEDMQNYREINEWLFALGFPENFSQYESLKNTDLLAGSGEGLVSDATLTILTSAMNPNIEVRFKDMFPLSLDSIDFLYSATDIDYILGSATFRYQRYEIVALS